MLVCSTFNVFIGLGCRLHPLPRQQDETDEYIELRTY